MEIKKIKKIDPKKLKSIKIKELKQNPIDQIAKIKNQKLNQSMTKYMIISYIKD